MTRAEIRENFFVSLDTLRTHKARSVLTVLGIVIGVTSVIGVASIIDGLDKYIQDQVASIGSRSYIISRMPFTTDPRRLPMKVRNRKYFSYTDAARLRDSTPLASNITTFGTRLFFMNPNSGGQNEIQYGNARVEKFFLRGVEPEFTNVFQVYSVARGRFVSRFDVDHSRAVIDIGDSIANSLFPSVDPIGKSVRMNGQLFEVIGIFDQYPGLFGAPGVDDFAIIPITTFHKKYPEEKELAIGFIIPPEVPVEPAKDQVIEAMRRLRRVPHNAENDFEVFSPDFLADLWDKLTGAMFLLTGVISSIGLLVGGIGVMNIMLISVTERTQEIGIRKAIGARRSDIRVQFLLEAVLVTMVGGIIGIMIGWLMAYGVRHAVPTIPAHVSYFWMAAGVAMSAGVGVFFGYYPANRAANLDPIVCLRYE